MGLSVNLHARHNTSDKRRPKSAHLAESLPIPGRELTAKPSTPELAMTITGALAAEAMDVDI